MSRRKRSLLWAVGLALICAGEARAQGWDNYEGGASFTLGEDDDKFIRFITWAQIWARVQEMNPGTTVSGSDGDWQADLGLRRARFLVYAKPRKNLLMLLHLGVNNQTFRSREANITPGSVNPFAFVHSAWLEQTFFDGALSIGSGLHYWWGLSRMTSASTLNFLAIDSPIFTWPVIQASDQFARQLGVYAKGRLGRLDYRFAVNRPFSVRGTLEGIDSSSAVYNPEANTWSTGGYVEWQFWDQESNALPYRVGSYLGTKRVLNIGSGFYHQRDGSVRRIDDDTIEEQDQTLFAFDVFLDTPLPNDAGALTTYAGYFNYDFGENHLRSFGIMNLRDAPDPAAAPVTANGPGNAYPIIGTGDTYYIQSGYLLPFELTEEKHRVMPFAAAQVSDFDALEDLMALYEVGINYFVAGHHAKYTLQYRNRPIFGFLNREQTDRASELLLQAHFWF